MGNSPSKPGTIRQEHKPIGIKCCMCESVRLSFKHSICHVDHVNRRYCTNCYLVNKDHTALGSVKGNYLAAGGPWASWLRDLMDKKNKYRSDRSQATERLRIVDRLLFQDPYRYGKEQSKLSKKIKRLREYENDIETDLTEIMDYMAHFGCGKSKQTSDQTPLTVKNGAYVEQLFPDPRQEQQQQQYDWESE